jgi:hypothetical protein
MSDASARLPIRRMTLYKHGVGFVERGGPVAGEDVTLVFRADEVNDALKSLLAVDIGGGQVLGIHYETPADRAARLAESGISLGEDHTLLDLLRALRGWRVRLAVGEATAATEYTGRLLGVETVEDRPVDRARVALLEADSNRIVNLPLGRLSRVELLDERMAGDLRFFLDTSMGEESHRAVHLRLSAGEHDLRVSYLVPSPTWRVSYRLVAESTKGNPQSGELLFQGWGLFDNRLEEDLTDVTVALVAGQPISFIYDLAKSQIPDRPVVEDEARVAAGPVQFADMAPKGKRSRLAETEGFAEMPRSAPAPAPMMAMAMGAPAPPPEPTFGMAAVGGSVESGATGSDMGELFQYNVTAPVTVRRGESALVPIISTRIPYERLLLYNGAKLPQHPVAAMRFTNRTGLVLERGPVTVLEDGEYRGEALVPFTKTGGEVYLAFAVELGIKVSESSAYRNDVTALNIEGAYFNIQSAYITTTTYTLENSLEVARVVTVEAPVDPNAPLVDTPAPAEQNAEFYRWTVECPPRSSSTLKVATRRLSWRSESVLNQNYNQLRIYLQSRLLDEQTLDRLKALLDEQQGIANNNRERDDLQRERDGLYGRQEQIRKNMAALGTEGEEGALRRKLFAQLSASEDRLAAIDARQQALAADSAQRQKNIDKALKTLRA